MRQAAALLCLLSTLLAACDGHPATAFAHRVSQVRNSPITPRLPLRIAHDLTVTGVRFGILKTDASGEDQFVATDEVPAVDGQVFGWVVDVSTSRASIRWQEHLRLPAPPTDWGDAANDPDIQISKDGRSVAALGEDDVEDGSLSRFYWSLASGDPGGYYELDVAIEGKAVAHFRFHVATPVQEQSLLVRARAPSPGLAQVRGARHPVRGA
jgi:hypothetical protein